MSLPISSIFASLRIGPSCGMIAALTPEICQIRGRKRGLKKPLSRQERILRRQKREEKEAARKQYSFMERINIRRMKSLLSPSQSGPGRYDAESEVELPERPSCDVFIRSEVRTQFYSIADALAFHRSQQRPEIYNNPNAPVKLRIELNMTTDKATKMISASDEIVPVPFPFKHTEKRTILAFAATPETQEMALEAGAETALGTDAVKKIVKGQFRVDDYDFCVAHSDMGGLMAPLRGIFRSRFPTKLNGAMGDNLAEIIDRFRSGVKVAIKGDPVYPMWGLSEPIVAKLNMPDNEVEENIAKILDAVCKHRSPALGPFINRVTLTLLPSHSYIPIDVEKYTPKATEEEIEKAKSKRKSSRAKKAKPVDEEKDTEKDDFLISVC